MNRDTINSFRAIADECIRRHNADVEKFLRNYLRENRTTRLDIELVLGEWSLEGDDEMFFLRRPDADEYTVRAYRNIGVRQKLPCSWRPNIPG